MERPKIDLHNPQKVLLIGNGILRSDGKGSWEQLINALSENGISENKLNTIKKNCPALCN